MTATIVESDTAEFTSEAVEQALPCEARILNADGDTYRDCDNEAQYSIISKCCGVSMGNLCEECLIVSANERSDCANLCHACGAITIGVPFISTRIK